MIIFFIAVSQKSPLLFQRCVNEIGPCWYGQCKLATLHRLFESLCLQRFPFPPPPLALSRSRSAHLSPFCRIQERLFYSVCPMKGGPPLYNHSLVSNQLHRLSDWRSKVPETNQYPFFLGYIWCVNASYFGTIRNHSKLYITMQLSYIAHLVLCAIMLDNPILDLHYCIFWMSHCNATSCRWKMSIVYRESISVWIKARNNSIKKSNPSFVLTCLWQSWSPNGFLVS